MLAELRTSWRTVEGESNAQERRNPWLSVTREEPSVSLNQLLRRAEMQAHGVKLGGSDWSQTSTVLAFAHVLHWGQENTDAALASGDRALSACCC
jgi:hypothetical protein